MILCKNGVPIRTLDDWFALAAPKGKDAQWVDGRSAKECANVWLETPGLLPPEIEALLSHPDFSAVEVDRIEPEALLTFDKHSGPRNADVAVWARDGRGRIAITIEAKADEPFGQPVSQALASALEARVSTPSSGALPRIADLSTALLSPREQGQATVGDLRYQLLTAVAGTLSMAHAYGADRAVMVVHELVSSRTREANLSANAKDLEAFLQRLSRGAVTTVVHGQLYGPFSVPGAPLYSRPSLLYVGKAIRVIGQPSA